MERRTGVSSAVFAGTTVVLLIVAAIGFSLYLTGPPTVRTTTSFVTTSATSTASSNSTEAIQFTPATGQMVHTAWLLIEPSGMGDYALSVYAQGLESTQGTDNTYLVEGAQMSGSMSVVPVGPNTTASEFGTTSSGVGAYFVVLMQNPYTTFENIQLVYVTGMSMSNATVVATANLTTMSH